LEPLEEISLVEPSQIIRLTRLGRRLLPILGALLLSAGMLAAWFTSLARAEPANDVTATGFDYQISITSLQPAFTVGSNNFFLIDVFGFITTTAPKPSIDGGPFPAGISIASLTGAGWSCNTGNNPIQFNCSYTPTITDSGFVSFNSLKVQLNIASNISTVSGSIPFQVLPLTDNIPTNNSANLLYTVDSVDLRIKKKVSDQFVDIGENINYTIDYFNSGPAVATNLRILDAIPINLKILSVNPPPSLITSTSTISYLNWTPGSFNQNITNTITMVATPQSGASGKQLINNISISSSNASDWKTSNNTASATIFVSGLEIEKIKPPGLDYTSVGVPYTYTINIKNNGTTNASSVGVTDNFDRRLTVTGAKIAINGGTPTRFTSGNNLSRSIGTLGPNQFAVLEVGVRGNSTISTPITVTNQATVRASPSIVRSSVITQTGVVTISPSADLYVLNNDNLTTVNPGQLVTYTVSVQNIGSVITHTNFIVTDTLVNWLDFVSVNLGTLVYTPTYVQSDNRKHVWQFGERLDPNKTITFKVTGKVNTSAVAGVTTLHRVEAFSPDEKYLGNNRDDDADQVVVAPVEDYNFTLTIDRTQVSVGEGIHFRIDLQNVGNSIAANAKVTDVFPSVLDIVDAATDLGTLTSNSSTRTVTVSLGSFAPGQSVRISITARVNSTATTSAVYEHSSLFTFNPNVSIESNTVKFSVLTGSGVLPGTGLGPAAPLLRDLPLAAVFLLPLTFLLPVLLLSRLWTRPQST
jgi:uncharacterized repeat protein (TIGR01451 family)